MPGRSLSGVHVGERAAALEHALGVPDTRYCYHRRAHHRRLKVCMLGFGKLDAELVDGRATQLSTVSTRQRTRDGAGPGTRIGKLKRIYPECRRTKELCLVGHAEHTGDRYTIFRYERRIVSEVTVGRYDARTDSCLLGCG